MGENGALLFLARKNKRLTQKQLADLVGHSSSYIARIETGLQRGSIDALLKIATVLDLPLQLVLEKAGFTVMGVPTKNPKLDLEPHQFAKLKPKTKKLALEIASFIEPYLQS